MLNIRGCQRLKNTPLLDLKNTPSYIMNSTPYPLKRKAPPLNEYPPRKTRPEWSSPAPLFFCILFHSFLKRCTYSVFYFFLWYSLVFLCRKGSHKRSHKKEASLLKNLYILQSVPRYRLSLEWLYEYIRSLLFLNQNVRVDIELVLKSFQLQSKGLRAYA